MILGNNCNEKIDIFDVKSDIFSYFDMINISDDLITHSIPGTDWYHPGRSANIIFKKDKILATFGEIHPKILSKLNIFPWDFFKPTLLIEIYRLRMLL